MHRIMGGHCQDATHMNMFFSMIITYAFNRSEYRSSVKSHVSFCAGVLSGLRGRNCVTQRIYTSIKWFKLRIGGILCEEVVHTNWIVNHIFTKHENSSLLVEEKLLL